MSRPVSTAADTVCLCPVPSRIPAPATIPVNVPLRNTLLFIWQAPQSLLNVLPAPPAQHMAGHGTSMLALVDHHCAVYDDVRDSHGVLHGVLERGPIDHRLGIEKSNISGHPRPEQTAIVEAGNSRRQRGHFANCVGQRQHMLLAHINSQYPRKSSVEARVGPTQKGHFREAAPPSEPIPTHGCFIADSTSWSLILK